MMKDLKPKAIVEHLDKFIISQDPAKRQLAIALRNRWRRKKLNKSIQQEIVPNNIILIGPTGVGKTEILRRVSDLTDSPYVKVEASKFTEVGYVGRDVESIIRDLVDVSVNITKKKYSEKFKQVAHRESIKKILKLIQEENKDFDTKDFEKKFKQGAFDDLSIDSGLLNIEPSITSLEIIGSFKGSEDLALNFQDFIENALPKQKNNKKISVPYAFKLVYQDILEELMDSENIVNEALDNVEENGIVFIDEIDKIVGQKSGSSPDVSREGVQRDLLPIIEGSQIPTKYGMIQTDHILFIAAGAFHVSSPADMIPELQGRFPIRVEMEELSAVDFEQILTQPKNALIKQYRALFSAEGIKLSFNNKAIRKIAEMAYKVNESGENIGARRLHTILTKILEDYLFDASELNKKTITISEKYVDEKISPILEDEDLSKYII